MTNPADVPRSTSARARDDLNAVTCVETIRRMMMSGEWRGGYSAERLSGEWGCEPATVRRYAAEASRQVALLREEDTLENVEADRQAWLASVNRLITMAESRVRTHVTKHGEVTVSDPDLRSALKGMEMLAAAKGISVTTDASAITASVVGGLMHLLANTLAPEVYAQVYDAMKDMQLGAVKRLPSGVAVKVERVEKK